MILKLICTAFLLAITSEQPPAYPVSGDIPPGPPGMEEAAEIGGAGMPLSGNPEAGAPVISMMGETTRAGETLIATGQGLDSIAYHYAADGSVPLLASSANQFFLNTADNRSVVTLPAHGTLNGTTLVFAEKAGIYSRPFRINGPRMFWLSPSSIRRINGDTSGNPLSVYGKNLSASGATNHLYITGPGYSGFRTVLPGAHENRIECDLPTDLTVGTYSVWAHNGTGKSHGWSEALTFSVYDSGTSVTFRQAPAPTATPSENRTNIQSLLNLGGTIQLQAGTYIIDQPLVVSHHYSTLEGVSSGTGFDYETGSTSGTATIVAYDGANCLPELVRVTARNTGIRNMVLMNGSDGGTDQHQLIEVQEKTCAMENLRLVLYDEREWGSGGPPREWANIMVDPNPNGTGATGAIIDDGCIFFNYPGNARGVVESCRFYTVSTGVRIGTIQNSDLTTNPIDPAVRQVAVRNCTFQGQYAGEANRQSNSSGSGRATGVVIYNGNEIGISGNHFTSANRANRRLLNRSVLSFNSSTRNVYIADNTTLDCGSADWAAMADNQGEQYLFHYRYTKGGIFDVTSASENSVVINTNVGPADPGYENRWYAYDQRGGWVPDEVGNNDHWYAFVVDGTGVGQYRQITAMVKAGASATLTLASPWRLAPDSGSRICLFVPMHHLVLRDNSVDCGNIAGTKSHLTTLWNDCLDNVIRNNEGYNLSAGVTINGSLWAPSAWNLVEGNSFSNMYLFAGTDLTAVSNAFIALQFATTRESVQGDTRWPTVGWYGVGNIARHNTGTGAGCGAVMANAYYGNSYGNGDPYGADEPLGGRGMQMCVLESNRFENIQVGVFTDCNTQFGVVRENQFTGLSTNRFIVIHSGHEYPKTKIINADNIN